MEIVKDEILLDPASPFRIDRQKLLRKENKKDHYHWHSCFEITYIQTGHGRYFVNDQVFEVDPGDIIIFNNIEPHGWEVVSEELDALVMVFQTEYVQSGFDLQEYDYLKPFVERGSNFKNKLDGMDPLTREIRQLMEEIETEDAKKITGFRFMIKADVLKLLTLLTRYSQDTSKSAALLQEKKIKMMRLSSAFDYINDHFTDRITLSETADIVYMSPNYFSTYFKKVTGQKFSEYINQLRIAKAENLMQTTNLSVLEIATQCGFYNMSNFYRQYKRLRGETPTSQRKTGV